MRRTAIRVVAVVTALFIGGCAPTNSSPYRKEVAAKQRQEALRTGVWGGILGAAAGAVLGAITGVPGLGAASGAVASGTSAAMLGSSNAMAFERAEIQKERLEIEKEKEWLRMQQERLRHRLEPLGGARATPSRRGRPACLSSGDCFDRGR